MSSYGFQIYNHNGRKIFGSDSKNTSVGLVDIFTFTGGVSGSKYYDPARYGSMAGATVAILSPYNSLATKFTFSGNTLSWGQAPQPYIKGDRQPRSQQLSGTALVIKL